MSTKFSGHGKLHKPPAVCKAPPATSLLPPLPHQDQIFQGYATWYYGDETDQATITAALELIPLGVGLRWRGTSAEGPVQLQLEITWYAPAEQHHYELTRLQGGFPVETVTILRVHDRQFHPFDSGLIIFPSTIPSLAAQARVNY